MELMLVAATRLHNITACVSDVDGDTVGRFTGTALGLYVGFLVGITVGYGIVGKTVGIT